MLRSLRTYRFLPSLVALALFMGGSLPFLSHLCDWTGMAHEMEHCEKSASDHDMAMHHGEMPPMPETPDEPEPCPEANLISPCCSFSMPRLADQPATTQAKLSPSEHSLYISDVVSTPAPRSHPPPLVRDVISPFASSPSLHVLHAVFLV